MKKWGKSIIHRGIFGTLLIEKGILQAKEFSKNSNQLQYIDAVFVSPLSSTLQMVEIICENNCKIKINGTIIRKMIINKKKIPTIYMSKIISRHLKKSSLIH